MRDAVAGQRIGCGGESAVLDLGFPGRHGDAYLAKAEALAARVGEGAGACYRCQQ